MTGVKFRQREVPTELRLPDGMPLIVIPQSVMQTMHGIVSYPGLDEVGWLGTVSRSGSRFRIDQVLLVEQEGSRGVTYLTSQGTHDAELRLLRDGGDRGVDLCNSLKFWGHSHVFGDTSASEQDEIETQRLSADHSWYLRGIFNKRGRIQFTLFLTRLRCVIHDVPWVEERTADSAVRTQVAADLETYVTSQRRYDYGGSSYSS